MKFSNPPTVPAANLLPTIIQHHIYIECLCDRLYSRSVDINQKNALRSHFLEVLSRHHLAEEFVLYPACFNSPSPRVDAERVVALCQEQWDGVRKTPDRCIC
jgi:hypothetical protein